MHTYPCFYLLSPLFRSLSSSAFISRYRVVKTRALAGLQCFSEPRIPSGNKLTSKDSQSFLKHYRPTYALPNMPPYPRWIVQYVPVNSMDCPVCSHTLREFHSTSIYSLWITHYDTPILYMHSPIRPHSLHRLSNTYLYHKWIAQYVPQYGFLGMSLYSIWIAQYVFIYLSWIAEYVPILSIDCRIRPYTLHGFAQYVTVPPSLDRQKSSSLSSN